MSNIDRICRWRPVAKHDSTHPFFFHIIVWANTNNSLMSSQCKIDIYPLYLQDKRTERDIFYHSCFDPMCCRLIVRQNHYFDFSACSEPKLPFEF